MEKPIVFMTIVIALAAFAATSAWYFSMQKELKNQAVSECLKASSVVSFSGDAKNSHKYTEPMTNWYDKCMSEKGYK
jgi:hypothetical protein